MIEHTATDAFILHRRSYRETSYLIDLFTADLGLVSAVAKGAARPKSPWRGLVEPFVPLTIKVRGKSELKNLQLLEQTSVQEPLPAQQLVVGLYLNELLLRLLPKEMGLPELFACYCQALTVLRTGENTEPTLRYFEKDLLHHLGLALPLTEDISGQPVADAVNYSFVPEQGFYPESDLSPADTARKPLLVPGCALQALAACRLETAHLRPIKLLLRAVIKYYLGSKPLKVREFCVS